MFSNPALPVRLRNLPLPARLVLSAFLISVGCGYFAALVQLHFQHASPGNALPTREDVVRRFYGQLPGDRPESKLQHLLEGEENMPFNGSGQMKAAFFGKSGGWKKEVDKRARKIVGRRTEPNEAQLRQAEEELRKERDTERLALLEWAEKGADKDAHENDSFCVSDRLAGLPIDEHFVGDPPDNGGKTVKVKTILEDRCVKCHAAGGQVEKFPLEKYEQVQKFTKVEEAQPISREQLTQSTHVHLLSFSMLYLLTGVIFAFTSLPGFVRCLIAPLPLVAQVVDVACWWLTRSDPRFADGIIIAGGVVAAGLMLHIVLGLFSMYGKVGKAVLLLLIAAGGIGAWQARPYVETFLAAEKAPPASVLELPAPDTVQGLPEGRTPPKSR
jgi:hypothetical protein